MGAGAIDGGEVVLVEADDLLCDVGEGVARFGNGWDARFVAGDEGSVFAPRLNVARLGVEIRSRSEAAAQDTDDL